MMTDAELDAVEVRGDDATKRQTRALVAEVRRLRTPTRLAALRDEYLAAAEEAGVVVRLRETYPKPPKVSR